MRFAARMIYTNESYISQSETSAMCVRRQVTSLVGAEHRPGGGLPGGHRQQTRRRLARLVGKRMDSVRVRFLGGSSHLQSPRAPNQSLARRTVANFGRVLHTGRGGANRFASSPPLVCPAIWPASDQARNGRFGQATLPPPSAPRSRPRKIPGSITACLPSRDGSNPRWSRLFQLHRAG